MMTIPDSNEKAPGEGLTRFSSNVSDACQNMRYLFSKKVRQGPHLPDALFIHVFSEVPGLVSQHTGSPQESLQALALAFGFEDILLSQGKNPELSASYFKELGSLYRAVSVRIRDRAYVVKSLAALLATDSRRIRWNCLSPFSWYLNQWEITALSRALLFDSYMSRGTDGRRLIDYTASCMTPEDLPSLILGMDIQYQDKHYPASLCLRIASLVMQGGGPDAFSEAQYWLERYEAAYDCHIEDIPEKELLSDGNVLAELLRRIGRKKACMKLRQRLFRSTAAIPDMESLLSLGQDASTKIIIDRELSYFTASPCTSMKLLLLIDHYQGSDGITRYILEGDVHRWSYFIPIGHEERAALQPVVFNYREKGKSPQVRLILDRMMFSAWYYATGDTRETDVLDDWLVLLESDASDASQTSGLESHKDFIAKITGLQHLPPSRE